MAHLEIFISYLMSWILRLKWVLGNHLECYLLAGRYFMEIVRLIRIVWARCTNGLHQCKCYFCVKKLLSGFAKDVQWKVCDGKAWTGIFVSFSGHKIWWKRVFKWIMQPDLLKFAVVNLLLIVQLFMAEKKHVLANFAPDMAAIVAANRRRSWEQSTW